MTSKAATAPRYSVIGFLTGGFGIAVAARNTLRALRESGRSVDEVTIQNRWAPGTAATDAVPATPGDLTLFHVNPPEIAWYSASWQAQVGAAPLRACVPFWELPLVPRTWEPVLAAMHAVLAPTRFVQEACARVMPPGRVLHYPQAVFPPSAAPVRDAWGFPPGATVFLVSFDIGSDIDRKNPWAAIQAFRQAFPGDPDVRLVIKTKPWNHVPAYRAQAEELAARVASDPRISIVDRSLAFDELMGLYASCDVMVALHRSEGLGLHLMEAMSLGRPVIATGWSGNMDFMNPGNSIPVRYALVPVRSRHDAYEAEGSRDGQVWAEADVPDAAQSMRALHASAERRRVLGAAAATEMEERRRRFLSGATFDELEAVLRRGGETAALDAAIRRTRVRLWWKVIRGAPRALARRAGVLRG